VLRQNSTNGALYVEFSATRIVERSDNTVSTLVLRDASGNFAAGTITANLTGNISGTAPAGTLTGTTLASNVVNSSLTSVGTLVNLTVTNTIVGSINGNAATATALATARTINGVSFNGTADITVTAAAGTLSGSTLAANVTASSLTSVGTLGSLTVTNPITGSVTGSSGSTTGNAATATTLQTARNINGVSFNGSADITVTAAAGTLSGSTLASGVTASSLTSVGTLSSLGVSGNLTVDTNTLFVDAGNNAVGIGTATPITYGKLAIEDTVNADVRAYVRNNDSGSSAKASFVVNAAGNSWRMGMGSSANNSNALTWDVDVSSPQTRMTLTTSGNLGLGVTPSAWETANSVRAFQLNAGALSSFSTSYIWLGQNSFRNSSGAEIYVANGEATKYQQAFGKHEWYTAPSGTAGNAISFVQAMTLDASGKFGLNTASPAYDMDLFATTANAMQTLRLRNGAGGASDGAELLLGNSQNFTNAFFRLNSGANTAQAGIGSLNIGLVEAYPVAFYTNNTERARITAAGGMVVGTAALATSATDGFLYVPTCAGTPTGTPTTQTGTAPIIVDTTNHKLYFFSGGTWRDAGP
jgi:hypothetical protein